jgi:uncharacterized membrane protein
MSITVRSTKVPVEKVWEALIDIEKYPERVKFVKKVKIYGQGEGSRWDDTTTILWFPLTLKHTITALKKNKEYSFEIPLSSTGVMRQKYLIRQDNGEGVIVEGTISYDLGNKLLNMTLSPILKKRLRNMLESSVRFIEGEVIN